jgi:hypothetical protein
MVLQLRISDSAPAYSDFQNIFPYYRVDTSLTADTWVFRNPSRGYVFVAQGHDLNKVDVEYTPLGSITSISIFD